MLDPKFVRRVRDKIAEVVQGGDDADRTRALDLLAERYAAWISVPNLDALQSDLDFLASWILAGNGPPDSDIRYEIQRDYLVAVDPSSEDKVDGMGGVLSTELWVEAAAGNLAPQAKERIGKEIKAHYDEALEEEHDSGLGSVSVHLKALERLGDPLAAAKIFRKTYLTAWEGYQLSILLDPSKVVSRSHNMPAFWFLALFGSAFWYLIGMGVSMLLFIATIVVYEFVVFNVIPPLARKSKGRRAYAWLMTSCLFVVFATFGFFFSSGLNLKLDTLLSSFIGIAVLVFFVYGACMYSFLLRKRLPFPDQSC